MVRISLAQVAISAFGLVFVVVGLYTANRGRKRRARSERIADTETTTVRNIRPGTVEVKGTAHPADDAALPKAPISRREALATRVEVEEWESSGQGGGSWETKHEERTAVPMIVDDGTGEVRVELPADGELNLEERETEVGSGDEPSEAIRRYVEAETEVGEATRHQLGPLSIGDRRRYSEGAIEPGEEVYVLGTAREERGGWGERNYAIDESTPSGDFVLSDRSESALIREGKRSGLVYLAFGGLFMLAGAGVGTLPWL